MHGQEEGDAVIRSPLPGGHQRADLGGDPAVRADHPLGFAGGAAGKEDHGAAIRREPRQRPFCRGIQLLQGMQGDVESPAERSNLVRILRVGHEDADLGRGQHVFDLRQGGAEIQRHCYPSGPPDPPLCAGIIDPRRKQHRHALFIEIGLVVEQARRDPRRTLQQFPIADLPVAFSDCNSIAMFGGAGDQIGGVFCWRHDCLFVRQYFIRERRPGPSPPGTIQRDTADSRARCRR